MNQILVVIQIRGASQTEVTEVPIVCGLTGLALLKRDSIYGKTPKEDCRNQNPLLTGRCGISLQLVSTSQEKVK